MIKKITLAIIISLAFTNISFAEVKTDDKSNINVQVEKKSNTFLILPFTGWQGNKADVYQKLITEKLKLNIKKYSKFDVFENNEFQDIIEKLNLSDNKENLLNFARSEGLKYIVYGRFSDNDLNYNDLDITSNSVITGRKIQINLEIIDVNTEETIFSTQKTIDQIRRQARRNFLTLLEKEFEGVSEKISDEINKKFLIKSKLISLKDNLFEIDKGSNDGIKEGMIFLSESKSSNNYVEKSYLRVLKAYNNKSNVFLISGKIPNLGSEISESNNTPPLEGKVLTKIELDNLNEINSNGYISLSIGKIHGVKEGDIFRVLETLYYKDKKNNNKIPVGDIEKGLVYVTEANEFYSKAKIIKGLFDIKEDMKISKYKGSDYETGAKVTLSAYQPLGSTINGRFPVVRIATTYEDIRYGNYFDFGVDFSGKTVNIAPEDGKTIKSFFSPALSGLNGSYGYKIPVINEYISILPSIQGGFSFGVFNNASLRTEIIPKVSTRFTLQKFNLWLDLGYSFYFKSIFDIKSHFSGQGFEGNGGLVYGTGIGLTF
jgi:hypothetical protein